MGWTHKQCLAVTTRFTPISICMQRIRCANGCVCLCFCVCVCVCVTVGGARAQRGPGGLRRDVDQITAAVIWGSDAESVCGRVGLIVAPESGAYTVACIDLRTFQEELPYYIALKTKHMFTLDAATPYVPFGNEKGRS